MHREQTDSCQKGRGLRGWVKNLKELRKFINIDNKQYSDYQREREVVRKGKRGCRGINVDGRRLDLGGKHTI